MKFFKKPVVAVIATILVVILSTGFSISIKLGAKCDEVSNEFFTGVRYGGELHPAIADQLRNLTAVGNGLCIIADNYEIDTEEVKDGCEWVEMALAYSPKDASYIYYEYNYLLHAIKTLEDRLYHQELSERHTSMLYDYSAKIAECETNINNAGYNESVRAFQQDYGNFALNVAAIFGAEIPDYFA